MPKPLSDGANPEKNPEFKDRLRRLALEESFEEYVEGKIYDGILFDDAICLGYFPTMKFIKAFYAENRVRLGLAGFEERENPFPKLPISLWKILEANQKNQYDIFKLPCMTCKYAYQLHGYPIYSCCPKHIHGKPYEVTEGIEPCEFYERIQTESIVQKEEQRKPDNVE